MSDKEKAEQRQSKVESLARDLLIADAAGRGMEDRNFKGRARRAFKQAEAYQEQLETLRGAL